MATQPPPIVTKRGTESHALMMDILASKLKGTFNACDNTLAFILEADEMKYRVTVFVEDIYFDIVLGEDEKEEDE